MPTFKPAHAESSWPAAPQSKNAVCAVQIDLQATSFSHTEILQKWADSQFSFITKGSIYYIKHLQIQLLSMVVDWSESVCLMEVCAMAMLYKYTYCLFTLYSSMFHLTAVEAVPYCKLEYLEGCCSYYMHSTPVICSCNVSSKVPSMILWYAVALVDQMDPDVYRFRCTYLNFPILRNRTFNCSFNSVCGSCQWISGEIQIL